MPLNISGSIVNSEIIEELDKNRDVGKNTKDANKL